MTTTKKAGTPILEGKHTVVFGAGGSIGAAVAREFAAEGAEVFLAGRTKSNVEEVAKKIEAAGGKANVSAIDALDDSAVNRYMDGIVRNPAKLMSYSTPPDRWRKNMETERTRWSCRSKSLWFL